MSLPLYLFLVIIASSVICLIILLFVGCWACKKCFTCREKQKQRVKLRRKRINARRHRELVIIKHHRRKAHHRHSNVNAKGAISPTDIDYLPSSDSDSGYGNGDGSGMKQEQGRQDFDEEEGGDYNKNAKFEDEKNEFVCCCAYCFKCCETVEDDNVQSMEHEAKSSSKDETEIQNRNWDMSENSEESEECQEEENEKEEDDEVEHSFKANIMSSLQEKQERPMSKMFVRARSTDSFNTYQRENTIQNGSINIPRSKSMDSMATTIVVKSNNEFSCGEYNEAYNSENESFHEEVNINTRLQLEKTEKKKDRYDAECSGTKNEQLKDQDYDMGFY